jgi:hypothetical protein
MKKFFIDLLRADSPLSSKRFAGLLTLISCIILAFLASSQNKWTTPSFMYDGLLLVVGGLFGFNMAESIFKKTDSKVAETPKEAVEEKPKETDKEEVI